jgi:hypothetical protein
MRQQQEYELYRTFIREITKFDIDTQVEAESEYLMTENKLLYNKLSDNDSFLLDYTPGCFLILGALAKKLPADRRDIVSVMTFEQLLRGYEYYKEHPPRRKSCECDFDIEHIVTAMAMQNITWSESHIVSMLRELGFTDISSYKVRKMLRKNQIPNSTHRTSAGISWRDFMENLKNAKIKGVIVQ